MYSDWTTYLALLYKILLVLFLTFVVTVAAAAVTNDETLLSS